MFNTMPNHCCRKLIFSKIAIQSRSDSSKVNRTLILYNALVCFIMCAILISKALRLARINEGSHSFTCYPHVYPDVE